MSAKTERHGEGGREGGKWPVVSLRYCKRTLVFVTGSSVSPSAWALIHSDGGDKVA